MNETSTLDERDDATGFDHSVDVRREATSTVAGCPMASVCREMLQGSEFKGRFGLWLLVPGSLMLLLGIAILMQPLVLTWVIGGLAVLLGALLIGGGVYLRWHSTGTGPVG